MKAVPMMVSDAVRKVTGQTFKLWKSPDGRESGYETGLAPGVAIVCRDLYVSNAIRTVLIT